MITEEIKNQNFVVFKKQLDKYNIPTEKLIEIYGDRIKNAPMNTSTDSGLAYDGAMINYVLKILTPYAIKLNDLLPESMRVDRTSLIKVCLLHQLSRAIMFQVNDNAWEVEKRNMVYKFIPTKFALKSGLRSVIICNECDIPFNEEEMEAMTILDRDITDEQARYFSSTMSVILRQANELSLLEIKNSMKK